MGNAVYHTNQDIPQEMTLGNLLFMNLTDMKISDIELKRIFGKNNIPGTYIRDISPADAFRRASSSLKKSTTYLQLKGVSVKCKIEVDEVRNDPDSIKRIIGIKSLDDINEEVKYDSVAELIFNRDTEIVTYCIVKPSNDPNYGVYQTACNDVVTKYTDWVAFHNKDTIRNIINRIVTDTHPVQLMPTGLCKFISSTYSHLLYDLKEALNEMSAYAINSGTANVVELIPVIDTEEQRDLIEKNFRSEITNELFEFTQELKDVLTKRQTLSVRSATAYIDKFNTLKDKALEYESLLGIYVNAIHDQIRESLELVNDNVDDE